MSENDQVTPVTPVEAATEATHGLVPMESVTEDRRCADPNCKSIHMTAAEGKQIAAVVSAVLGDQRDYLLVAIDNSKEATPELITNIMNPKSQQILIGWVYKSLEGGYTIDPDRSTKETVMGTARGPESGTGMYL